MEVIVTGIFVFGVVLYVVDSIFDIGIFDKLEKLTKGSF